MTVTGIICEYNPFHRGHALQLELTRERSGEDCALMCVMGGNFVQRGEPAIVSKHARAEMAVRCGADLVVELPVPWALASAERFAWGGVALLDAAGADRVSFGAECADQARLTRLANALLSPECGELIKKELSAGVSYAAARERAALRLVGGDALLLRQPNNILAVEYLKAIARRGSTLRPIAVERSFASHDGGGSGDYASASHIRELIASGGDYGRFMPEPALEVLRRELEAGRTPDPERLDAMAMYRLRTMSPEEYASLPNGGEGLWMRFERLAKKEPSLKDVLDGAKTKRYAYSRLRRMSMAALLGMTGAPRLSDPPYIRVLAIGQRGREALRQIKPRAGVPVITKPSACSLLPPEARAVFDLDIRAGVVYALSYKNPAHRLGAPDLTTSPFVLK